jgi:glycosyltransferase involved in cell wall biosynthesis
MFHHQILDTGELGGGNLYALAVAERLQASGQSAPVWIGAPGPAVAEAEQLRLPVRRFDQARLRAGKLKTLGQLFHFYRAFRREPGLVHVHSMFNYAMMARVFKPARIRSVAHVHIEAKPEDYRWAFRKPPDAIVTCAKFLAKQVEAVVPAKCRIVAIPNAVDTVRFSMGDRTAAKATVQAPSDRPLILMAANLAPHKGQETAIRALAELRTLGTDAELWLAGVERGSGMAFTQRLHELVKELQLSERVRFLGQRSDMPELMRAADALVLPSTNEGLPLTLLEAQAIRLPVLAAPTAGIPEIVTHGETGWLIAADDASGYARQLHELFRDVAMGKRVASTAYANILRSHTMDALMEQLQAVYREVLVR